MDWQVPTLADVLERDVASRRTCQDTAVPLPGLNELLGTEVFVKHENYQPVGAFKVRGGINLISQLARKSESAV